jgi:hypothetical protein
MSLTTRVLPGLLLGLVAGAAPVSAPPKTCAPSFLASSPPGICTLLILVNGRILANHSPFLLSTISYLPPDLLTRL